MPIRQVEGLLCYKVQGEYFVSLHLDTAHNCHALSQVNYRYYRNIAAYRLSLGSVLCAYRAGCESMHHQVFAAKISQSKLGLSKAAGPAVRQPFVQAKCLLFGRAELTQ